MFPRALVGLMRSAVQGSKTKLKSVSELDPSLLAKARQLALGVGTAAGAFGSLVGVGGGVLIGPVILNACPAVPQRIISGTSLAAVATTGATAGAVYWSSDCVDARSAAVLAATAVLTAPFGAKMTHRVDCQRLRTMLGYWLYFVAPLVPLKAFLFSNQQEQQQQPPPPQQQQPAQGVAAAADTAGPSSTSSSSSSSSSSWGARILQELQQPPSARDAALAATGSLAGFASGMLGIGGVGSFAGSNFAVGAPAGVLEALFAAGMLLLGRRTLAAAGKAVPKAAQ
ncbi:hypothetical protein OEZ86_004788 [Tetradesmus obliquus]|nr:hypothetical protein OEZ86_004788 [Tetradesmus obliquus]